MALGSGEFEGNATSTGLVSGEFEGVVAVYLVAGGLERATVRS